MLEWPDIPFQCTGMEHSLSHDNLLFVDDEPSYLSLITRLLDKERFSAHTSSSPREALDYCKENEVDVLITDLIMPEMNGIQLIEAMREIKQELTVVIISAQQDMNMTIQAMNLGNIEYIRKPITYESLMIGLESALEKRHLRQQLEEANRKLNNQLVEQGNELEKSRAFFNAMAENSQEILIELDLDLNYSYCSPNVESVCGFRVDEIIGRNLFDLVQDKDKEQVRDLYNDLKVNPKTFSGIELGSYNRSGELMYYETTGIPLFSNEGKLTGFLGLLRNVTEEKKSRKRIETSRNLLRTAVESIPFEFFSMDKSGTIILQNKRSREGLWGEMSGRNILDIPFPNDNIKGFKELVEQGFSGTICDCEWEFGGENDKKYFRVLLSPILNTDGVSGLVGFNIDISNRKSAEAELLRVSAAVDQVQESIILTDLKGRMTFANPAFREISGYSREEYLGHSPFELLRSSDGEKIIRNEEVKDGLEDDVYKLRAYNLAKDDTEYVEDVTISPIRNNEGDIIQYVCVGRNITEELQYEKKLMHAQKMEAIGTLAGGIAHDFNNILSSITGYTQLVQDDIEPGSEAAENVSQVLIAAMRAEKLIKQILLFGRREQQQPIAIDAVSMIKEVISLLKSALPSKIKIDCSGMPEQFSILADPTQLHQVILNLCTNAIDAMRENGGVLTIEFMSLDSCPQAVCGEKMVTPGKWICVKVRDTGMGIPESIINKIFDPFFTTKPLDKGTGMGLSVVHGIVNELNGFIQVESTEGEGTTFFIYLPVGDIDDVFAEENNKDYIQPGVKFRILIVDDDLSILNMEKLRMTRDGWAVHTASSGEEALKILSADSKCDMVITDLKMPEMNGEQLCREIKKQYSGLPVILSTSHLEDSPYSSVNLSLFDAVLRKPVPRQELINTVFRVLSGKL